MSELASNMGAAFVRLIAVVMLPIVDRTLQVLDQQNLIDLPLQIDGQQVKVVPISPLAKAQNSNELEGVLQFTQMMQGLGQAGMMAVNVDGLIAFVADRLGVPARVVTTKEERQQIMAEVASVAQQGMQQPEEGAPLQ